MSDDLLTITIPLEPTSKKNSQRILFNSRKGGGFWKLNGIRRIYAGVPFIAPSVKFEQYQSQCRWYMKRPEKPIDEPIQIACTFYRKTKNRCDLTNLLEAVDDILVHYGVIADDSWKVIRSHDGSRVRFDKENPRTEITITYYTEEEA